MDDAAVDVTMRVQRECDLTTYYDNEVHERAGRELPAERVARRGDAALAEIVRVLRPAAPLAVGLWGGRDLDEGPAGEATHGPARFFSFRSDEKARAALERHGVVEQWVAWLGSSDLHYQFAVVRTPT